MMPYIVSCKPSPLRLSCVPLFRIEEIRMVDIVETEMADIVVETEMVVIVGGIVATTEVATVMEVEVVTGVVVVVLVMALVAITEEEITLSPSNYC